MELLTGGASLIDLPTRRDERGALTFMQEPTVPFDVKRIFYLYDVAAGSGRGGHAHRALHQFMIALHGSFVISLDDGRRQETLRLSRPSQGLHVRPMVWADLRDFDPGTVCLVLASAAYDEADYIRSYEAFKEAVEER